MATVYTSELFQINCSEDNVGECAVMVLLAQTGSAPAVIKSCILIDGGFLVKSRQRLLETLAYLESRFMRATVVGGVTTYETLTFDAVSLSHWDKDHWYGVYDFINLDCTFTYWDDPGKIGNNNARCNRFKYTAAGEPLTRFYCSTVSRSEANGVLRFSGDTYVQVNKDGKWRHKVMVDQTHTTANNILGVNLFNARLPLKRDACTNLAHLVSQNDPWQGIGTDTWTNAPALYVVGIDQVLVGPPLDFVIDGGSGDKESPRNAGSILLLLVWKRAGLPPRVAFYSGGDAEFKEEKRIVAWLNAPALTGLEIEVVKAGHHGSRIGTSTAFIEAVKPTYYLVSAGRQFGHPVLEIIWYLDAWFSSAQGAKVVNGTLLKRRIFAVCFPYFFGLQRTAEDDIAYIESRYTRPETFDNDTTTPQPWVDYRTKIKSLHNTTWEAMNVKFKKPENAKYAPRVQILADESRKLWESWSPTDYTFYPVGSSTLAADASFLHVVVQNIRVVFGPNKTEEPTLTTAGFTFTFSPGTTAKGAKTRKRRKRRFIADPPMLIDSSTTPVRRMLLTPQPHFLEPVFSLKNVVAAFGNEVDGDLSYGTDTNPPAGKYDTRSKRLEKAPRPFSTALQGFPVTFSRLVPFGTVVSDGLMMAQSSTADAFINNLREQVITIEPAVIALTPQTPWIASVSPDDEFAEWWSILFPQGSSVSFSVAGMGSSIIKMLVSIKPFPSSQLQLNFSSSSNVLGMVANASNTALASLVDAAGFTLRGCTNIMGLETVSSNSGFTMSDIFQLTEVDIPPWLSALTALNSPLIIEASNSTGPGALEAINALWFSPASSYNSCIRLTATEDHQSVPTPASGIAQGILAKLMPNCNFGDVSVVGWKTTESRFQADLDSTTASDTAEYVSAVGAVCIRTTLQLSSSPPSATQLRTDQPHWDAYLLIQDTGLNAVLQWNSDQDALSNFIGWIETCIGSTGLFSPFSNILKAAGSSAGLKLRQVKFTVDYINGSSKFDRFSIDFEVDLDWGIPPTDPQNLRVPCLITFSWERLGADTMPNITFAGGLWPLALSPDDLALQRLVQNHSPYPNINPTTPNVRRTFSILGLPGIKDLGNAVKDIPADVPTEFTNLEVTLSRDFVSFAAAVIPQEPAVGSAPKLRLDEVSFSARYMFNARTNPLDLQFQISASLPPKASAADADLQVPYPTARLIGTVAYISGLWILTARVQSLQGAALYSLFPQEGDHDAAVALLQDLNISALSVSYVYAGKVGNSFSIDGLITLGKNVVLALNFTNNDSQWKFFANLAIDQLSGGSISVDLRSFLTSIAGPLEDLLPASLAGMSFTVTTKSKVDLECQKTATKLIFSLLAEVEEFEFSFVQITTKGSSDPPKRLFRFECSKLPAVDSIPMLNRLTQPFDQMDFLWLSDDLTNAQVTLLNENVYKDPGAQLSFVDPSAQASADPKHQKFVTATVTDATDPIVIGAGCHFMIVAQQKGVPTVILDYDFKEAAKPSSLTKTPTKAAADTGSNDQPKTAPLVASVGPLSITSIGLSYKSGSLKIMMSATIALGPVAGLLNDFSLSVPFNELHNLSIHDLAVNISGIGLSYSEPPLQMSGLLLKIDDKTWEGGVSIEYEPYTFLAGGLYGRVPEPSDPNKTFTTTFVFARLDGPIIELELATVSGITGGFGYNNRMQIPDISNVTQFPFLRPKLDPAPLQILNTFLQPTPIPWFTPTDGDIWLAAGLTCVAFQVLNVQAVAAISFNPDLILGIFADCSATVPLSKAPSDESLFVLVEMGLLAILDPGHGIFQVQGQLTPQSFVLDRSCHLSGGFALCYWYGPSGHAGDWVFSIGGYHPAFRVPGHYPNPPRLAISWSYDDKISISGTAYFAITPKACMGGGTLSLVFHSGLLSAWFDAWADFLINFRPFKFIGDVGVDIGIRFSIDLYFVTLSFGIDFSASLHLEGPPMAGFVYIDWDIISFTIHFGNSDASNEPLTWEAMWELLSQTDDSLSLIGAGDARTPQPHRVTATTGLASNKLAPIKVTEEGKDLWAVDRSAFAFKIRALFPITTFTYQLDKDEIVVCTYNGPATYVKPMHTQKDTIATSDLHLEIATQDGVNAIFQVTPIVEFVPAALWDFYDPSHDPNTGAPAPGLLDPTAATIPQLMGISLAPSPQIAPDVFQPFQVVAACAYDVFLPSEPFQPSIAAPSVPAGAAAWVPKMVEATDDPRNVWATPVIDPASILTAWTKILDGGVENGYMSKLWSGLGVVGSLPATILGNDAQATAEWNDEFAAAPPAISVG